MSPPAAKRACFQSEVEPYSTLQVFCDVGIVSNIMQHLKGQDVVTLALRVTKRMSKCIKPAVHTLDACVSDASKLGHFEHFTSMRRFNLAFRNRRQLQWCYKLPQSVEHLSVKVLRLRDNGDKPLGRRAHELQTGNVKKMLPFLFSVQSDANFGANIRTLKLSRFERWDPSHVECLSASRLPLLETLTLKCAYRVGSGDTRDVAMDVWMRMFESHANLTSLTFHENYNFFISYSGTDFSACASLTHLDFNPCNGPLVALPPNLQTLVIELPYKYILPTIPAVTSMTDLFYRVPDGFDAAILPLFASYPLALERLFPNVEKMSFLDLDGGHLDFVTPPHMLNIRNRFPRLTSLDSRTQSSFPDLWQHLLADDSTGAPQIGMHLLPDSFHACVWHTVKQPDDSLQYMPPFHIIQIVSSESLAAVMPKSFSSIRELRVYDMTLSDIRVMLAKLRECRSALLTLECIEIHRFVCSDDPIGSAIMTPIDFRDFQQLHTFRLTCHDVDTSIDCSASIGKIVSSLYTLPASLKALRVEFQRLDQIVDMHCGQHHDTAVAPRVSVDLPKLCRRLPNIVTMIVHLNCALFERRFSACNSLPFMPHLKALIISAWRHEGNLFDKRHLNIMMSHIARSQRMLSLEHFILNLFQPTKRMVIDEVRGVEGVLTFTPPNPDVKANGWTLSLSNIDERRKDPVTLQPLASWHTYEYRADSSKWAWAIVV